MKSTLFIPKKLKIGFQNRGDTFTGKLAYVIYYDEKGKLRKESSWESWRDKKIDAVEIDNTPRAGFVLNKGLQRNNYYHWGSGRSVIRVHHPDAFEFEISVENLIGILMHSDVSKRDIVEECVFAWSGTDLVLLPVNSEAYQSSVAYTEKQDQKVSAKSLVEGRQYALKKSTGILTYIGYHEWYAMESAHEEVEIGRNAIRAHWHRRSDYRHTEKQVLRGKKHVFFDGTRFVVPSVATLSTEVSADVATNYAELVDRFFKTTHSQPIVDLTVQPVPGESFVLSCYNREALHRLDEAAGAYEQTHLPGDFIHYLQHGNLAQAKASFKLTCMRYTFAVTDGVFHRSHLNYGSQFVHELPFDATGVQPAAYGPADFVMESTNHPVSVRCSERFMGDLRDQGYGKLIYILKNGNLSTGENA